MISFFERATALSPVLADVAKRTILVSHIRETKWYL